VKKTILLFCLLVSCDRDDSNRGKIPDRNSYNDAAIRAIIGKRISDVGSNYSYDLTLTFTDGSRFVVGSYRGLSQPTYTPPPTTQP